MTEDDLNEHRCYPLAEIRRARAALSRSSDTAQDSVSSSLEAEAPEGPEPQRPKLCLTCDGTQAEPGFISEGFICDRRGATARNPKGRNAMTETSEYDYVNEMDGPGWKPETDDQRSPADSSVDADVEALEQAKLTRLLEVTAQLVRTELHDNGYLALAHECIELVTDVRARLQAGERAKELADAVVALYTDGPTQEGADTYNEALKRYRALSQPTHAPRSPKDSAQDRSSLDDLRNQEVKDR